jgi:hypothetical protein
MPGDPATVSVDRLPMWNSYFQGILPPIELESTELKALTPPPDDAALFADMLAEQDAAIGSIRTMQQAASADDLAAFQAAWSQFSKHNARVSAAAQRSGLTGCAD